MTTNVGGTCHKCGGFSPLTFEYGPHSHPSFAVMAVSRDGEAAVVCGVFSELGAAKASPAEIAARPEYADAGDLFHFTIGAGCTRWSSTLTYRYSLDTEE